MAFSFLDLADSQQMFQLLDGYFAAYPHRAREVAQIAAHYALDSPVLSCLMYIEMAEFGAQHGWISHQQCQQLITTIRQMQTTLHNTEDHHG